MLCQASPHEFPQPSEVRCRRCHCVHKETGSARLHSSEHRKPRVEPLPRQMLPRTRPAPSPSEALLPSFLSTHADPTAPGQKPPHPFLQGGLIRTELPSNLPPGPRALSGSTLRAYITCSEAFCENLAENVLQEPEKSGGSLLC